MVHLYDPVMIDENSHVVKKIITHKIEKVELKKSNNRWTCLRKREDAVDSSTGVLFRKFQSILNKLTPQNFKDLAECARKLEINTEERLQGCIDRIMANVYHGPMYSVAYAHLCRVLSVMKANIIKVNDNGDETVRETTFRRELLTRLQRHFENESRDDKIKEEKFKAIEKATPEEKSVLEAELNEWENKAHKRSLANVRFMGELFKLKMLSESIMHDCIVRLLRSVSDDNALECFCVLITVTGKELDHQQAKVRINRYFERIEEIIKKKKISTRIKFLLQDVQEMRKNDWIPRKLNTLMTIDQIHREVRMEALQEKEMIRAYELRNSLGEHFTANMKIPKDCVKKSFLEEDDLIPSGGISTEELLCIFQGILNMLTVQNFKYLAERARKLEINTEEKLKGCIDKIFLRVIEDPTVSRVCAHLCFVLSIIKVDIMEVNNDRDLSVTTFRRELLMRIQKDFEKNKRINEVREGKLKAIEESLPEERYHLEAELNEWENKTRKRSLANVRFMGELFKLKMLSESIMHECIVHLLRSVSDDNALECFCVLITVTGKVLDHQQAKVRMDRYFQRVEQILEKKKISTCTEFMLQEVLEMRKTNWIVSKIMDEGSVDLKMNEHCRRKMPDVILTSSLTLLGQKEKGTPILGLCPGGWKSRNQALNPPSAKASYLFSALKENVMQSSSCSGITLQTDDIANPDDGSESSKLAIDSSPCNSPYLKDLTSLFASQNNTIDDILDWIEKHVKKEYQTNNFVKTLARAAVAGSSIGEGSSHSFNNENFGCRLMLLKKWIGENEDLHELVLEGVQIEVTLLRHPTGLLHKLLHSLYDYEVVSEVALYNWYRNGKETFGRTVIIQSSKRFFNWLESVDTEDCEGGT